MEPEYGKGPVMDAGFDNWSLVPLLGVSIVFVALFGVVINVGLARPPPEPPPSNSVESVIDRPLLHVSTIDCLLLHASPIVDHHLFHGLTYAAADLCPFLGAGFYGARSTADFCLSLDYGWYSGGGTIDCRAQTLTWSWMVLWGGSIGCCARWVFSQRWCVLWKGR